MSSLRKNFVYIRFCFKCLFYRASKSPLLVAVLNNQTRHLRVPFACRSFSWTRLRSLNKVPLQYFTQGKSTNCSLVLGCCIAKGWKRNHIVVGHSSSCFRSFSKNAGAGRRTDREEAFVFHLFSHLICVVISLSRPIYRDVILYERRVGAN